MDDKNLTKGELRNELAKMRQRIAELQESETQRKRVEEVQDEE